MIFIYSSLIFLVAWTEYFFFLCYCIPVLQPTEYESCVIFTLPTTTTFHHSMISFLRLPIEKFKDHEGLRKQEGWERTQDPEGWGKQGEKYQIQKTIEGGKYQVLVELLAKRMKLPEGVLLLSQQVYKQKILQAYEADENKKSLGDLIDYSHMLLYLIILFSYTL